MTVQYLPFLSQYLDDFLPHVRVGIDFGEHAGGIAVVKGNDILHAETYVDFHDTDLEMRRRLRRGRRTRHAKKMRLARLRSWVMRQSLPDGSRLPDPYEILSEENKQYWVQPGRYQVKGIDPASAPSWIDLAKRGEVDAAGFVRAITLLFKKRGYKYDNRTLSELSDKDLKKFLEAARIPAEVADLRLDIENEIARREENPNHPARGRQQVAAKLRELFKAACNREREPRVAEPREVKEAELRAVIDGFGRCIGLSDQIIARWKRELVGEKSINGRPPHYGLINKVLRPARFDNRVRSGCSRCGKKTPRKYKVRDIAYRAAVNNLRAKEGWRDRPLTDEEKTEFFEWFDNRVTAPGLTTIKRRLNRLNPRQAKMANQLYDLLKNAKPGGRTNLCKEHLEMAAQGKTMKDAGVDWQTLRVRNAPNPKRENHDKRVLHRLEQILFRKGYHGEVAWRHGSVSILSIEVPDPQTEQLKRGQVAERKEDSFKDRLLKELDGKCVYCGDAAVDKDHIFPRSKGGPDIWNNLVAVCKACNDRKADRTPYQAFGSDSNYWREFSKRVELLPIAPHKKELLLNATDDFPGGNPTPFARVGSRTRSFVAELKNLFGSYGVLPPQLNYQRGKCHVQITRGRLTAKLRESWLVDADGRPNFPKKDRFDLHNHAQDAAIVAGCPPHTWLDRIFLFEGERVGFSGQTVIKPGLAIPELAPSWAAFMHDRKMPLVRVLGNYPINWKSSLFNQTLWQGIDSTDEKRLIVYKQVKDLKRSEISNVVSPYYRERLAALAERNNVPPQKTIPGLREELPNLIRVKVKRNKPSGVLVIVQSKKGPARKLAAESKSASEGAVFWKLRETAKGKFNISIIRPRPLQRFGVPRYDAPIPKDAFILGTWKRYELIELEKSDDEKHPAGWYRVKEFSKSGVIVLPENAISNEIAIRMELGQKSKQDTKAADFRERSLGKRDLDSYFSRLKSQ